MRREVESLLEYRAEAQRFIERPAFAFAAEELADEPSASIEGQRIGHYKVVREIGRGGMGAVYLAERADDVFDKLVAIKLIKRGMDSDAILRRFVMERQILAQLDHPHIARLLDGGTTADGAPFLVMEYVEGTRIDDYCRQEQLSIDERLNLFLAVCQGVSYAHQHLVVHRDIKPSNILVTSEGTPKLLDFGIAKLLDAEHADDQTHTNLRAFTPEYASPEQARGESVTTASDVYSLGTLLHDLLHGARPSQNVQAGYGLWRAGHQGEKTNATNSPTNKKVGNTHLKSHISQSIGVELKNIIAMARREEPARRYASVAQFAEDIQRYLDGLPVRAQRDSVTYRSGKFVKRNRLPVAALALVIVSLIAGVTVAAWQAGVAREKARIAERNEARAELAVEKQKKITGFMEKVLSYANPAWYAEGYRFKEKARVLDVLNELSGKIETEFPQDLDIQAELHHKCAEIFLANRMLDRAEMHARRALELRRQIFGERHAEVAKDMYYLGEVLANYGNLLEDEKLLNKAAAIFREVAPDNANLPYLLESLANLKASNYNDFDAAENLFAESLELFRRHDGEIHFNTARLYFQLSLIVASKGETARAEELFREGETRLAQLPKVEQRLLSLRFRGHLEFAKGNLAAAEATFNHLIDESRKLKGANNGFERGVRDSLLNIYERENDWEKAAEVQRAQFEDVKKQLPETSLEYARQLARLSVYLLRDGKTDEARQDFEKAYRIFQNNKPKRETSLPLRQYIAECLLLLNRRAEALPFLEGNYEFYKANYPPNFIDLVRAEELLKRAQSQIPLR